MSDARQLATSEARRNHRLSAQSMLDSYRKNLDTLSRLAEIRRDGLAGALRRHQDMVQNLLGQVAVAEGFTAAQQDTLKKTLERRLAAIRNFTELTEASNKKFSDAVHRRMTDWCDEISQSLLGAKDDTAG
jgi:phage-related tail protein